MISAVCGVLELRGDRHAIIATDGGLLYRVFASAETLRKIPEKPQKIKLWTHFHQRENTAELYGFLHYAELEFFELLLHVSGIGPKSGLSIMSVAPVDILRRAIASGDTSYLTRVSGIGRKIADKIILELREKMAGRGVSAVSVPELKDEADALDALMSLGYNQREARDALSAVPADVRGAPARVKAALKSLSNAG